MDIADQKRVLRRTVLAKRARLSASEREAAGAAIARAVLELVASAATVVAFASFGSEVPTDRLIESLLGSETVVLLPYVDGSALRAAAVSSLDEVAPGYRGIREPVARTPVEPAGPVLVPGVAFDPAGHRLGYGGGFYDEFLAASPAATPRIGICFDCQIVDAVPTEAGDQPVEYVVTEARVLRR